MEEEHKVLGIHLIKLENENDPLFSDEWNNMNESKKEEATLTQDCIKKELNDETSEILTTENDPLAFSDEDNERTDNNDANTIYIKEELAWEQYIKVENDNISNMYKYKAEETKQNIDIKEDIKEYPVANSNVVSASVYADSNQKSNRNNDGKDITSMSDDKHLTYQEFNETVCPVYSSIVEVNTVQKVAECNEHVQCRNSYTDIEYLNRHINNVHRQIKTNECHICNKTFKQLRNLKMHIRHIHDRIKYKCEECKKHYSWKGDLRKHIYTAHIKLVKHMRQICIQTFTDSGIVKHIRNIHEEIKYNCEICEKSYSQLRYLRKHINNVHKKFKEFECQICNKTFSLLCNFKRHMRSIHKGIKYMCEECKVCYTQIGSLKRHINSVHKKIKNHICKMCKKAFTGSTNLKKHMINMHKVK